MSWAAPFQSWSNSISSQFRKSNKWGTSKLTLHNDPQDTLQPPPIYHQDHLDNYSHRRGLICSSEEPGHHFRSRREASAHMVRHGNFLVSLLSWLRLNSFQTRVDWHWTLRSPFQNRSLGRRRIDHGCDREGELEKLGIQSCSNNLTCMLRGSERWASEVLSTQTNGLWRRFYEMREGHRNFEQIEEREELGYHTEIDPIAGSEWAQSQIEWLLPFCCDCLSWQHDDILSFEEVKRMLQ